MQHLIRNDRATAFTRAAVILLFIAGGGFLLVLGQEENSLRKLIIGGIGTAFGLYWFPYYAYYVFASKVYLIVDEEGVRTPDGSLHIAWQDAKQFYFGWTNFWLMLSAVSKKGEVVDFPTGNVLSVKKVNALLKSYGAEVFESSKKKKKRRKKSKRKEQ